jgi:transposase
MTNVSATGTESSADLRKLHIAFELSAKKWLLASSDGGVRIRTKSLEPGDGFALAEEIGAARKHFRLPVEAKVVSCYEAGRDGFWVHRWVTQYGVENVVIDASSLKVDRKARRSKSDGIDVRQMLADLVRYHRGEEKVFRVVRIPPEEIEDKRRVEREIERLQKERTQHRARIRSLLATQGIRLRGKFLAPEELVDWEGKPFGPKLKEEIAREMERLSLLEQQMQSIERQRKEEIKVGQGAEVQKVRKLSSLRGIGGSSASMLVFEFFAWRDFHNRREVGGAAGLGGTPYNSGCMVREQGISKAGNSRIRTRMVELAWLWLQYQPNSKLSCWFHARFARGGSRQRRTGIVAVARRLLIDLWHLVEHGVVPEGAVFKSSTC